MSFAGVTSDAPPLVLAPRAAVQPAAPVVPGEVVAALQEGRHDDARVALRGLREKAKDRAEREIDDFARNLRV